MSTNDEAGADEDFDYHQREHDFLDHMCSQLRVEGPNAASATDAEVESDNTPDGTNGTDTGATDTGGAEAANEPANKKKERVRKPNKLGTDKLLVTEVHPGKFEPIAPAEARKCYGNQVGCILRETASINDYDLRSIPNMEHLLLTKLHNRFKFPDRDESKTPWDDDAMTDINAAAMVKFSNALAAWKVRVKRLIEKNTPWSKIFAENPSLTEAEFLKFKDTCATDEAKLRSEKFKGLQKRNTGKHRLGSRGYIGKRPIWEKEDAEREAAGIPDPLAEFTDPQEYDFIRARYKWDSKKKVWSTDAPTRELMRLLVNFFPPYISFSSSQNTRCSNICKWSTFLSQKEQHKLDAESDSSSQSTMRPKWDTHLNRALNILKGVPVDTQPQHGRVHGVGDGAQWKHYYHEDTEAKRQRRKFSQVNIDEKVKLAVEKKAAETEQATKQEMIKSAVNAALAACRDEFASSVSALIPAVIEWTKQNPDKTAADFPRTSFVGSNSVNIAPAGPDLASGHAPLAAHSSPSSVSGVLGGPSPLAELDALTVITRHTNISIIYPFFVAFWMSDAVDMFSQAERTPCTLLYMINGQTVDVGNSNDNKSHASDDPHHADA